MTPFQKVMSTIILFFIFASIPAFSFYVLIKEIEKMEKRICEMEKVIVDGVAEERNSCDN